MYRAAERDLTRDVRKAYADYDESVRLRDAHGRHDKILSDFEKIADAKYKAGTVPQTDVLKSQIELSRLRTLIADNERAAAVAVARLNQLMHRPGDAPLGPPPAEELQVESFDLEALLKEALAERPEMRAAQATIEAARAQQRLAGVEATVPEFDVDAMYGFVSGRDDMYDAGFGMTLPWLNSGRSARERAAGRTLAGSEDALLALADGVAYEVRAGRAEVEAARKIAELYRSEIVERARQAVEVTRKGYENNTVGFLDLLDAERSHRDAEQEYARAMARYRSARAMLDRAVGR
jgi:cobalt-zinc-cadmium efflux system outer membrane protein